MSIVQCAKCRAHYENGIPPIALSATGHACPFEPVAVWPAALHPEPAQAQVTEAEVEAACVAAYSACDMGSFPAMAVAPDSDRRIIRAALEAAARARGTGEERG